ncbi:MAG: glycosyltransferase family 4 protein [Thiotrichales bacterium]|nr:glycosyltransferase family 4 protein [Thiotrichales bacterium]
MKVLHFYKTYRPESFGGVEQVIYQLCEGGQSQGVESEVLYLSRRGSARNQKVGHHVSHRSKLDFEVASTGFSVVAMRDFYQLSRQADIVHFHYPWPFMDLVHFLTFNKKPTVVSYHSDIVKQKNLLKLYTPLMERFLSHVDVIVAASPNYVEFSPVLAKFKDKVEVISYGMDESIFPTVPIQKLEYWRSIVGEKFFLFVGALRYYKGLRYLLEAAKQVDYPIVIVGSGGVEEDLKSQADALKLTNVFFLGSLPDEDKVALLTLCYGFVFPSHLPSEAFGISLLEAAIFSKPMISCEIGTGTTYINIDGETGLTIEPADPIALAQAMTLLWNNPELAKAYGLAARKRYQALFKSKDMVQKYQALYTRIIAKGNGSEK